MAIAAEQLINKVLQTGDFSLVTLNNITDKYFEDTKAEFNFIKNHLEKYGKVPDRLTFASMFPDFVLFDVSEPDKYLIEKLYEDHKRNVLIAQFNEMRLNLKDGNDDKAFENFQKAYEELQTSGVSMEAVDLFTDTSRYDHYLDRTMNRNKYFLSTGLPELDAAMGGIDRENENMVIAARTGVGKTQLLCKMASASALQGLRVGFYEGEMTADKLGSRIDTMIANISNTSINRGDLFIQKQYKEYIDSLAATGNHLYVLTPDKIGGPATVDALRTFIEKYKLDILFIDQYSLLEDGTRVRSEYEKVANISKKVKNLQVMTHIPIISVTQMNRTKNTDENGKEAAPDATQIANADRIGQDATNIFMLSVKDGILTLHISKCRDGASTNKLQWSVNFTNGTFDYIPVEGDGIATKEDFDALSAKYDCGNENPF